MNSISNFAASFVPAAMSTFRMFCALFAVSACEAPENVTPTADTAPTFVGSVECRNCHDAAYAAWQDSHHQQAMQVANNATVLGDFSDVEFEYYDTVTRFMRKNGNFVVRTANADGVLEDFAVIHTFGVEPLQQYLVELPDGRLQALPFAWDTRPREGGGQRWFHLYPDERISPGDELYWTGRNHNWNYMCAECHSTDVAMNYDAQSRAFDTTYAEISVGCEACHGPGSLHVTQARKAAFEENRGLPVDLDDGRDATWIMNPDTGVARRSRPRRAPQQQPEACGRCHARRSVIDGDYDYGRPLTDTHLPSLLEQTLYFADGQILDEVYVYGSFVQSRMYRAGVTCTDCHDPHAAELSTGSTPSDVCSGCHLPATFASEDHAGHAPEEAACVDCHMPSRTYMQVDERRDHSFRVPRPDQSAALGTPDTCTRCHQSQDPAWAAGILEKRFGDPGPHFGSSLHAGRTGFANATLTDAIVNRDFPAIARATALTLLRAPAGSRDVAAIRSELGNESPLLRIAALRSLSLLPPAEQLDAGSPLLDDPVRGVRLEAARSLAAFSDILPVNAARRFARAAEEYRAALKDSSNRPESLAALGDFERDKGSFADAETWYRRALALESDFVGARLNLADVLSQTGDEHAAGEVLRAGLELANANAALHHALGLHRVRAGRPADGLSALRKAAELEPTSSRYTYVLGIALNSLGHKAEALELLDKAQRRFPTDYEIGWALATINRDRGNIARAREIANDLEERFPDDPDVAALNESLRRAK